MNEWLLNKACDGLSSLAGSILSSLGWGGIVGILAGCLLLLSLSAKSLKFLSSPRGMATTVAIMVLGLASMWWTWGKVRPAAASVASLLPAKERPTPERVHALAAKPKPAKTADSVTPDLDLIPEIPAMAPAFIPPLPNVTTTRLPPIVVPLPQHPALPRKPGKGGHAVTTHSGAAPAAKAPAAKAPAAKAPATGSGNAGSGLAGSSRGMHSGVASGQPPAQHGPASGNGDSPLTAAQRARQSRANHLQQMDQMNQMMDHMFNQWGMGMGHPGGMHPMGGGHPGGAGHGMGTHPMGGHMGGGHR